MEAKLIPGTTVALGGEDYVVPPLAFDQLFQLMPRVRQIAGLDATQMGEAQIQILIEIVTAALRRNYPDLDPTKVAEILDLGNALPVLDAILGGGKLPRAEPNPSGDSAVGELSGFQRRVSAPIVQPGASGHAFLSGETNSDGLPAGPLPEGAEPLHRAELDSPAQPAARAPYEPGYPWRPNPPVVSS